MTSVEFIPLNAFPNYEISTSFPFIIRNTRTHRIVSQSLNNVGYLSASIDGTSRFVHRIVAQQFINNDIEGMDVNHINGNRIDNRIENLEIITHADNLSVRRQFNKQQSQYIKQINSDNVVQLQTYNGHTFDKYFFDKTNQILYLRQERNNRYKVVNPTNNGTYLIVALLPSDQQQPITCGFNKLVRYMNTIN